MTAPSHPTPPEAKSTHPPFRVLLVKVLAFEVVILLLLGLLQARYTR